MDEGLEGGLQRARFEAVEGQHTHAKFLARAYRSPKQVYGGHGA
jgi:hypothetical protein